MTHDKNETLADLLSRSTPDMVFRLNRAGSCLEFESAESLQPFVPVDPRGRHVAPRRNIEPCSSTRRMRSSR